MAAKRNDSGPARAPMTVQLDLMGMCVIIRDGSRDGRLTIGLLEDPTHIHMLLFTDEIGRSNAALLLSDKTEHQLKGCIEKDETDLVNKDRLPNVPQLVRERGNRGLLMKALGTSILLPHATFEAQLPIFPDAEGPWKLGANEDQKLTDRCRFTSTTENRFVEVGSHRLYPRDNTISATLLAIDHDVTSRKKHLTKGFKLEEFQMFYRLTAETGPVPVYNRSRRDIRGDPGNPICPDVLVELA